MKTNRKIGKSIAIILVILLTAFVLNCGGGGGSVSNSGSTKVTVSIGQSKLASFIDKLWSKSSSAIPSNVASVSVTVSGPGIDIPMQQSVNVVAGQTEITMTFNDVPNGTNRDFLAVAMDASGVSLFQGDTKADLDGTAKNITIQMGFDISGEWTFTLGQGSALFTFAQTGNSLTFSATISGGSGLAASSKTRAAAASGVTYTGSGSIDGDNIQLSATGIDCGNTADLTITGQVTNGGTSINGTFTQSGGCLTAPETLSLSAEKGNFVPQFDVTGAWSVLHTPQGGVEEGPDFFRFIQTGNSVTFSFPDDHGTTTTGSGTVSGNNVQLSFSSNNNCDNPATTSLTGTISADGNTVSGSYTVPGSGSCGETGTWSAMKAQPPAFDISGSWSGFRTPQGGAEQGPVCITFTQAGSFLTFSGDIVGSGIISENSIQFRFAEFLGGGSVPNCKIVNHLTGTITSNISNGDSASGTYTTSGDCPPPLGVGGTWRAVKGACTPVTPQGTISGTVTDALTGSPLAGVSVTLSQQGSTITTGTTGADGTYALTALAVSGYSIEFSKSGYITSTVDNIIITANATATLNAVLSPVLSAGQTRIVLTWGSTPADLDSHLTGPIPDSSSRFHVYFDNHGSATSSPFAVLDLDDTDGFGPETTTITQQFSGGYRFSVHDFTNLGETTSVALSNSGAQVQVFRGSTVAATFNIRPNQVGTLWTVFELNGDVITTIDTMSNQADYTLIQSVSQKSYLKKTKKRR